jgi:DNA repair protein RadA/Sms
VLSRHAGVQLGSSDVFVSVAGGVRVEEPGADLAIALAVTSAARGVPLGDGDRPVAAFGEIGLTGELRYVAHPDRRIAEASKFGLAPVLAPSADARTLRAALASVLGGRVPERAAA